MRKKHCSDCNRYLPTEELTVRTAVDHKGVKMLFCGICLPIHDAKVEDYMIRLNNFNEMWKTASPEQRVRMAEGKVRLR